VARWDAVASTMLAVSRGGSAQLSVITRGRGAQHRLLTVRPVDLHAHLLSARVEVVMETYRRRIGEQFNRERNECAPRWSGGRLLCAMGLRVGVERGTAILVRRTPACPGPYWPSPQADRTALIGSAGHHPSPGEGEPRQALMRSRGSPSPVVLGPDRSPSPATKLTGKLLGAERAHQFRGGVSPLWWSNNCSVRFCVEKLDDERRRFITGELAAGLTLGEPHWSAGIAKVRMPCILQESQEFS
jgi:hypothetical protein